MNTKNNKGKPDPLKDGKDIQFPPVYAEEKILEEIAETTEATPGIIPEEDPFENPGYEEAEPGEGP